ncbi:MAG: hypothetical protein HYR84_06810 [Planctomycetes bacterium]|nr:hypothetical protein [Planctomycetota bacterium]
MTCETCRQQMLPFLFDLLEPLERESLAAHVERCPECQAALAAAKEQQGILAEAVKEEFSDVVFKAPVKTDPASSAATVVMPAPVSSFAWINRWSIAAAILFLLIGAGGIVGGSIWRHQASELESAKTRLAKAKGELTTSQDALNKKRMQTQKEIRAIQDQIDTLFVHWKAKESTTRKNLEKDGSVLNFKGPQNFLAGANNPFAIELRQELPGNLDQQKQEPNKDSKGDQRLQMRVVNQRNNETIYEQPLQTKGVNKETKFNLPSTVPIRPGDDVVMQFQMPTPDGKSFIWCGNVKLVTPEYVAHLATDRPNYAPGETVRFRSLTLERFHLKPAQERLHLRYRIVDPRGAEVYNREFAGAVVGKDQEPLVGPKGEELHCLGVGDFALPPDAADGKYTLAVSEANDRFPEETRTFAVRRRPMVYFKKEIQFDKTVYRPGDTVKLKVRVDPGTAPNVDRNRVAGANILARVIVNGGEISGEDLSRAAAGRWAKMEFKLPDVIANNGIVQLECFDGNVREKLVREIPLIPRDVQIECYPEGGDLIAGAVNRVYFQARTPANKPIAVVGRILDDIDEVVGRFETSADDGVQELQRGLGVFAITPQLGKSYRLKIDQPAGIARTIPLPKAKMAGVVLQVAQSPAGDDIDVRLQNVGPGRELLIGAYCRGRMLDNRFVRIGADQPARLVLRPSTAIGGVYRVTVFEKVGPKSEPEFRPIAERLIYRKHAARVDIAVVADKDRYAPGEAVAVTLKAKNETGTAAPAIAMLAVIDSSAVRPADEKTERGLPAHFLLASEIRNPLDLEYADFLLSDHPKAATALDLHLGSQGWRRFAEQNPQEFQEKNDRAAQPGFLANCATVTQFLDNEQKEIDKVDREFVNPAIDLQKKLVATEQMEDGPPEMHLEIQTRSSNVERTALETEAIELQLTDLRIYLTQFGLGAAALMLLLIAFGLLSAGLRRWSDGTGFARHRPAVYDQHHRDLRLEWRSAVRRHARPSAFQSRRSPWSQGQADGGAAEPGRASRFRARRRCRPGAARRRRQRHDGVSQRAQDVGIAQEGARREPAAGAGSSRRERGAAAGRAGRRPG